MFDIFNVYLPIAEMQFNALILVAIGFSVGAKAGRKKMRRSDIGPPAPGT